MSIQPAYSAAAPHANRSAGYVVNFVNTPTGGTFTVNTTKATEAAAYDVIVRGRVGSGMNAQEIYARPVAMVVTERRDNVQTASAQ